MTKIDVARTYIEKYIEIGQRTGKGFSKRFIATVLYSENPEQFKDAEDARKFIRAALNALGSAKNFSMNEDLTRRFTLISEPQHEITNPEPYIIPKGYKNTLVIGDIHSKFYNRKALEVAINDGVKSGCDSVIINGDFMDFYQFSKFDKNPRVVKDFYTEQEWGVDILSLLQDTFGIVYLKKGNHDIRLEMHIQKLSATTPELQDYITYQDWLFYKGTNTVFVEDYRHIQYGKLNIIHGHEYQGGGGIHVAHNRLNKTFDNVLSAHSHKSQSMIKTTINREVFGSWAIGCMCSLSPRYCPKNDWTNGYAIINKDSAGDFEVENKVIFNNKIFSV